MHVRIRSKQANFVYMDMHVYIHTCMNAVELVIGQGCTFLMVLTPQKKSSKSSVCLERFEYAESFKPVECSSVLNA